MRGGCKRCKKQEKCRSMCSFSVCCRTHTLIIGDICGREDCKEREREFPTFDAWPSCSDKILKQFFDSELSHRFSDILLQDKSHTHYTHTHTQLLQFTWLLPINYSSFVTLVHIVFLQLLSIWFFVLSHAQVFQTEQVFGPHTIDDANLFLNVNLCSLWDHRHYCWSQKMHCCSYTGVDYSPLANC